MFDLHGFKKRKQEMRNDFKRSSRNMFLGFGLVALCFMAGSCIWYSSCIKQARKDGYNATQASRHCSAIFDNMVGDDD